MVSTIQDRVKEIQQKIASCLSLKTSQLVFEFNEMPDYVDLDLFTINAVHKQQFFFYSTEGRDKIEALEMMLKYAKNNLNIEDSFTIQWKQKGTTRRG